MVLINEFDLTDLCSLISVLLLHLYLTKTLGIKTVTYVTETIGKVMYFDFFDRI